MFFERLYDFLDRLPSHFGGESLLFLVRWCIWGKREGAIASNEREAIAP
ncbi:hypothetical protein [Coleofasciculus sp.]